MLEVDGLSKIIDGKKIFGPISFAFGHGPGECLFVVGPSGTGKTLLLRLISCLDIPPTGYQATGQLLLWEGKTPKELGLANWRSKIMYVPQSRSTMQGTPMDLWHTVASYSVHQGRADLLDLLDLTHLVESLGLDPTLVLHQQWSELSGGQSQRISIAIAVALRPAVLLLDEPSSALDQASTLLLEKMLKQSKCALIWVSHDQHQPIRVGGRILQLSTGQIQDIQH